MKRPILLRLHDMLEAIETADEIVGVTTFAEFDRDRVKRFAVERCIEIVSEASRHIPEAAKQEPLRSSEFSAAVSMVRTHAEQ